MSKPTITPRERFEAYVLGLHIAEKLEKQHGSRYGGATGHEIATVAGEFIAEIRLTERRLSQLDAEKTAADREALEESVAALHREKFGVRETSLSLPIEYVIADNEVLDASVLGARLPQEAIDQLAPTLLYEKRQQDRYADESDRTEAAIDAERARKEVAA